MARSRWYPFILVGLLFGFWGLVGVNRLGIQFLFPFIVKDFRLNLTQVSLLVSGTSATWAISSCLSGWLSDRYGRRNVLVPGARLLWRIPSGVLGWLQVGVVVRVLFLQRVLHASPVLAGRVVAISTIGAIAGTLLLPALSDYVGRKPTIVVGALLSAVLLGVYVIGQFPIGIATALLTANAFFEAAIIPLGSATYVVELVGEEHRATTMGGVNLVGVVIGTFLLPLLAGTVGDHFGLPNAYLIAVVCVAIAGLLALALPETAPRVLSRRG